ncbi:hypothetical protein RhiirA4_461887 [Rhizophagus irregularis]|uniref:Uncharacterized protein n=1 Tax=Rhizophagus irregularis TaxID=588596 RepID=A0A2I1GJU3_9GLOM|nr:hypothetical protein RhiirA4_461887 [Rhizophagus irregularis]
MNGKQYDRRSDIRCNREIETGITYGFVKIDNESCFFNACRDQVMKQCGRDKRAIGHSRSYKENDDKTNKTQKNIEKQIKEIIRIRKTEEQEAFYSKSYDDFQIPDNNVQNNYKIEIMQQQIENINLEDENEIHNNPNLHPEEQDELEIPDSI